MAQSLRETATSSATALRLRVAEGPSSSGNDPDLPPIVAPGFGELRYQGIHLSGLNGFAAAMESRDDRRNLLILDGIEEFREHLGGALTVTMLRDIGCGEEVNVLDQRHVLLVWEAVAREDLRVDLDVAQEAQRGGFPPRRRAKRPGARRSRAASRDAPSMADQA